MAAQSDLHVEAHHLEVLNDNFRRWPHVRFPQPFYASAAVIIETYEPGRIVTGVVAMYERLADTLNSNREHDAKQRKKKERAEEKSLKQTTSSSSSTKKVLVGGGSGDDDINNNNAVASVVTVNSTTTVTVEPADAHRGGEGDDDDEEEEGLTARDLIPIPIAKFLVTTGLGVYLKMLLVDNLMHAGNADSMMRFCVWVRFPG